MSLARLYESGVDSLTVLLSAMSSTTSCRRLFCKTTSSIQGQVRPNYHFSRRTPELPSPEVTQLIANYVSLSHLPLNLSTLLSFGRPLTPESLLSSVSYALAEIPRRLATRVRSLEALPYIVGTNPYVAKTLKAYRESFKWLATYPPVETLEENAEFAAKLEDLVQMHANDIPTMAKG